MTYHRLSKKSNTTCIGSGAGMSSTSAISAYHHWRYEFKSRSRRGVLDTTLCGKVNQWLATGRWFSRVLRFPPPIFELRETKTFTYYFKSSCIVTNMYWLINTEFHILNRLYILIATSSFKVSKLPLMFASTNKTDRYDMA
jgi:hypothetical protein